MIQSTYGNDANGHLKNDAAYGICHNSDGASEPTPEQVAEAVSYIQAAAPERGSAEHFSAIRELLDLFSDDQVPASVVEPYAIGALGKESPLARLKAIDAAFVMAVARHRRSDLDTPTDIAIMLFIKVYSDNRFARCTEPLSRMMAFARVDRTTVQRRLRKLKDAGFIGEDVRDGRPTAYWLTYDSAVVCGSAYDVIGAIAPNTARPAGRPSKTRAWGEKGPHSDAAPLAKKGWQQEPPHYQNGAALDAAPLPEKGPHSEQKGAALRGKRGGNGCSPAPTLAPTLAKGGAPRPEREPIQAQPDAVRAQSPPATDPVQKPLNGQPKVMTAAEMAAATNPEAAAAAAAVTIGEFGKLEISSGFRDDLRKAFTESQIDRGLERAPANMGSTRDPLKIMQQVRRCCSYAKQDDDAAEKRRLRLGQSAAKPKKQIILRR
jgi:hypothetical protein